MLEEIALLHVQYPRQMRLAGNSLVFVGGLGLVAGAIAQVGRTATTAVLSTAGQAPVTSIEQLWPGMPTGFVPESLAGLLCYCVLVGVGIFLALAGKEGERIWKAM